MKRFFVDKIHNPMILTGDNHKHLSLVLRARIGDEIVLCPGDGNDYIYEISGISKRETRLTARGVAANPNEPTVRLTVFSALMKGDKNEWAAQKLTELGVSEIVPFYSEHTVARPSPARAERLRRICEEAAKQCGRAVVPTVGAEISFETVLSRVSRFDLVVFPYEKAEAADIRSFLQDRTASGAQIRSAALIVGSEGGFSDTEAEKAVAAGLMPVTMGKRILRAETANIAAAAVMMYALGEMR